MSNHKILSHFGMFVLYIPVLNVLIYWDKKADVLEISLFDKWVWYF